MSRGIDNKSMSPAARWALMGAMFVVATAAGSAAPTRHSAARAVAADPSGPWLEADLSERKLTIHNGNDDVATYTVAVGRGSYETPVGNYSIRKIVWNPAWIPPDSKWAKKAKPQAPGAPGNPMKLVKIFFKEPDYYIHGTNDPASLGKAESHGCLRMDPDDAYDVARYLMENGGQPRDENWFWRVLHFRSQTKTVYLDDPIPMVVKP
ncbi:MAG TPA: L,D-transpeptidase [Gemmatimonadaceae bacterium]|nr:L,D-transpeptidase [Gemmatimonadaceae bacterium]